MLAQRHMHLEWEIIRWIAILGLALAIALAVASLTAQSAEPLRLPPQIDTWSAPLEVTPDLPGNSAFVPAQDVGIRIWALLDDQQSGRLDRAVEGWPLVPLPPEREVWREVALAEAHIAMGNLDSAASALDAAANLEPDNAVVHYYLGILRLEQAERAPSWYEPSLRQVIHLAAYGPMDVVPNSRDMYHLVAMGELEQAIVLAPTVALDDPLIPGHWPTSAALRPTVGDLLQALGADRFDAKAHNMLGYLHMESGALSEAEHHMDAAADAGMMVALSYEELGKAYEAEGHNLDAFRAYAKAAGHGGGLVHPVHKMIENLYEAFTR